MSTKEILVFTEDVWDVCRVDAIASEYRKSSAGCMLDATKRE